MDLSNNEEITQELEIRLRIYRRNLSHYLKQQARVGESHVPTHIFLAIEDVRAEIQRIKKVLRDLDIEIDDHPDDEPYL